jgi:hypothetical protein
MYNQMLQAQDPVSAQQSQMGAYRPASLASQIGSQGQMGMSVQQMQQALQQRGARDVQQVDNIQRDGMAAV